MAYAGALFADSCLRGLNGDSNVFDYSYVESDITDVPFFSSRVDLGPEGETPLCCSSKIFSLVLQGLFNDVQFAMHQCSPILLSSADS